MRLLQDVDKTREVLEGCHRDEKVVLENFGFRTLEEVGGYSPYVSAAPADISAAKAYAGERDWRKQLGSEWGSSGGRTPDRYRGAFGGVEPEEGDVVEYRGKLYRLGGKNADGDFESTAVATGRQGLYFLPQLLKKKFYSKRGKDNRRMWIEKGAQNESKESTSIIKMISEG